MLCSRMRATKRRAHGVNSVAPQLVQADQLAVWKNQVYWQGLPRGEIQLEGICQVYPVNHSAESIYVRVKNTWTIFKGEDNVYKEAELAEPEILASFPRYRRGKYELFYNVEADENHSIHVDLEAIAHDINMPALVVNGKTRDQLHELLHWTSKICLEGQCMEDFAAGRAAQSKERGDACEWELVHDGKRMDLIFATGVAISTRLCEPEALDHPDRNHVYGSFVKGSDLGLNHNVATGRQHIRLLVVPIGLLTAIGKPEKTQERLTSYNVDAIRENLQILSDKLELDLVTLFEDHIDDRTAGELLCALVTDSFIYFVSLKLAQRTWKCICFPGGKPKWFRGESCFLLEDPSTAALRELKEEAGLVPVKHLKYEETSFKVGDIEVQYQLKGQLREV